MVQSLLSIVSSCALHAHKKIWRNWTGSISEGPFQVNFSILYPSTASIEVLNSENGEALHCFRKED